MNDQLVIGKKSSFDDYEASIKERFIGAPKKKAIKETVPFSNTTYDFSAINGEIYWEERELEYVFEIIAENPDELEQKKTLFSNWIMNVMNEELYDPHDTEYHFRGTFESIKYDDDESVEKTTVTVKFTAYPYKISNRKIESNFSVASRSETSVNLVNTSAHRISPTITLTNEIVIILGGSSYAVSAGTYSESVLMLQTGNNVVKFQNNTDNPCGVSISYSEEVF